MPSTIAIQIPAFNEAETIEATLSALPRELRGFDKVFVVVVDDGSDDETVRLAKMAGADLVVSHGSNRGLAQAFMTGLQACLRLGADVIVNTDADHQYPAHHIRDLVAPIQAGSADIVVGDRPINEIESFSRMKRVLQRLGSKVVSNLANVKVKDAASGFRALNSSAARRIFIAGKFSYTLEMLIQATSSGLRVASVPITVNAVTRPSRLMRSTVHYVRASALAALRAFALYHPFRFFMRIGLPIVLAGLVLFIRWAAYTSLADSYSPRLPSLILGTALLVCGLQICILGFLGDQQNITRRHLLEQALRSNLEATEVPNAML